MKDPADVVQAGDRINVRVLEVDMQRKRISLTAKKKQTPAKPSKDRKNKPQNRQPQKPQGFANNPFAGL